MSQIKVLQIITQMVVGGASEHVAYLVTQLPKERYEVHLLSGTPREKAIEYVNSITPSSNIAYWQIPELVVPGHPIKDFVALWKIYRFLKRNKYQIVHTNSSKAGILGRLAAYWAGVPIVLHTIHGWSFTDYGNKLVRNIYICMERFTAKHSTKLINVTQLDIERGVNEKIASRDKFTVIHTGIEINKFSNPQLDISKKKECLGIKSDSEIVGMIGRLHILKAPDDFVRVAEKIIPKRPNCIFLFVGDGPMRQEIEILIHNLNLDKKVILTGFRSDIHEIIPCMDVHLFTSLKEGLPRVFPQSMAAAIPIVATKIDGALEIIEDGVNGFLVEPRNVDGMAEKVLYLLENKEKAREMGEKGRKKVDPDFSVQYMLAQTNKLYSYLLLTLGSQQNPNRF